ncbi:MAG TPA: SGNH/GDSL hydrolase family protein [Gemmatimonadales bacterium]|nr:SGNH/GDSL hydrolase family protein [Gemmatimonadales bacterium]
MTIRRLSLAAGLVLAAVGCSNDDLITPPVPQYKGGPMFQRYVAMGNSITAGFQSGGINDSTQQQSYVALVAGKMGSPFYYPSLTKPGCPPPIDTVFTATGVPHRLGGGTAATCVFRAPTIPPFLTNVAVPGAEALDLLQNGPGAGTNSNALTLLMLGGRTQIQAMMAAHPTFVSVWAGNNDVLGAATSSANAGDSTLITPVATLQATYSEIVDSVGASGASAILIGVANVTAIPFFSSGATYFALKNKGVPGADTFPTAFTVSSNCAPIASGIPGARGDSVLVPFPYGGALLAAASPPNNQPRNLDCADTVAAVVVPAELRKLVTTVAAYNAFFASQATAKNWAYLDPNPTLDSLRLIPTQVAPFPNFKAACSGAPFGLAFTCDGVHPSASTHLVIARHIVQAINAKYGSAIPAP